MAVRIVIRVQVRVVPCVKFVNLVCTAPLMLSQYAGEPLFVLYCLELLLRVESKLDYILMRVKLVIWLFQFRKFNYWNCNFGIRVEVYHCTWLVLAGLFRQCRQFGESSAH